MALKDEPFVLRLNECETPRNARKNRAHAASHNLLESFNDWEIFLVERRVLRDGEDHIDRRA
jgi:hypothetical protein